MHIWLKHRLSYQSIEHKSIKRFTVWVLHHNVEEGVQSVLQKLNTQTHTDYKTKLTITVRCVSVFLQEARICENRYAVSFMDSRSKPHAVHFNVGCHSVDAQWQSTKDITAAQIQLYSTGLYVHTIQTLKQHVHSLCSLSFHWTHHPFIYVISILFHKVRAFRKCHVLIIITVIINQGFKKVFSWIFL